MGKEETEKFLRDALVALMLKYTEEQANLVVDFFRRLRSRAEIDLVGEKAVEAFGNAMPMKHYSGYDSMMARLWIYAPYILENHNMLPMKTISECVVTCLEVQNSGNPERQCCGKCKYRAD